MPIATAIRIATENFGSLDNVTDRNAIYFHFEYDSAREFLYSSRGNQGFEIIDTADPSNPTRIVNQPQNSFPSDIVRYALRIADHIYTLSRIGSFSADTGRGQLNKWDVSTPATPSFVAEHIDKGDASGSGGDSGVGAELYSSMRTDGTHLFVSTQVTGVFKFDLTLAEVASNITGSWETQGLAIDDTHVFTANYRYGVRILLKSTLADVGSVAGFTYDSGGPDEATLRPWEAVVDSDTSTQYVYYSTNTSNADNFNNPGRGLLVLDVSTPATPVWVAHVAPPAGDQSTGFDSNSSGDSPHLGISKIGDFVFIANGFKGSLVYYVEDPLNPVYLTVLAPPDSPDTIFATQIFLQNSQFYLAYGDGQENSGEGNKQLYINEINIVEPGMADLYVGLDPSNAQYATLVEPGGVSSPRTSQDAFDIAQNITVPAGFELVELGVGIDSVTVDGKPWEISLFDSTGAAIPTNLVAGSTQTPPDLDIADGGTDFFIEVDPAIPVAAGDYQVCFVRSEGGFVNLKSTASGAGTRPRMTIVSDSLTNTPFVNDNATTTIVGIWAGFNAIGPPTLSTAYLNQFNDNGDSPTVDLSTSISGGSSFTADGLPPGLTMAAATGVVTGTITEGGNYTVTVNAKNDLGELAPPAQFQWFVDAQAQMFTKLQPIGANGNWYNFNEQGRTITQLNGAFFSNQYAASVLKTDDFLTVTGSDGTKIYQVTVVQSTRTVTLTLSLTFA